jgi:hypothetical protein
LATRFDIAGARCAYRRDVRVHMSCRGAFPRGSSLCDERTGKLLIFARPQLSGQIVGLGA